MSKQWNPGKKTVELNPSARPSRIRREPPPPVRPAEKAVMSYLEEREAWVVTVGIIMFGLAVAIIILGFSDITSK